MMSLLRVPSRTSARDVPTIVGLLPKHLLLASALGARTTMMAKLAWTTRIAESHALVFMGFLPGCLGFRHDRLAGVWESRP
jgi:hypothetical protein